MWKKVIGWILFAYGIFGIVYSIVTGNIWTLIAAILIGGLCIWGGWKLAHSKKQVHS